MQIYFKYYKYPNVFVGKLSRKNSSFPHSTYSHVVFHSTLISDGKIGCKSGPSGFRDFLIHEKASPRKITLLYMYSMDTWNQPKLSWLSIFQVSFCTKRLLCEHTVTKCVDYIGVLISNVHMNRWIWVYTYYIYTYVYVLWI